MYHDLRNEVQVDFFYMIHGNHNNIELYSEHKTITQTLVYNDFIHQHKSITANS